MPQPPTAAAEVGGEGDRGAGSVLRRASTGVVVASAAAVVVRWPSMLDGLPACPSQLLFGFDCPLCGSTRAVQAVAHGDIVTALDHNVLLFAIAGMLAIGWAWWVAQPATRRPVPSWVSSTRAMTVWLWLAGVFMVLRNLPVPGLEWLAAAVG